MAFNVQRYINVIIIIIIIIIINNIIITFITVEKQ